VRYLTYRRSNEDSHFILPWADHAGVLESAMPFCSPSPDEMSKHRDSTVRLAHVLCRHAGYMIATNWYPVSKEDIHTNSTGLKAYCRGDEQLIDHCQWTDPAWHQCDYFLAIDCGECSNSFQLTKDARIRFSSPGFPVYIPLVTCEWNITLPPDYNLMIVFHQFDLPVPIYDDAISDISCRSASLDILPYREDINKMALDGRFCGRHIPENMTIFSNRILIRFTAGSYRSEVFSKKGFVAECWLVPAGHVSNHMLIVRWILIACAITATLVIAIFILIWRGRLCGLHALCWEDAMSMTSINDPDRLASSSSSIRPALAPATQSPKGDVGSFYRRHQPDRRAPFDAHDLMHRQQTNRLAKWRSARSSTTGKCGKGKLDENSISIRKDDKKDDSHIYEEIDLTQLNYQHHHQQSHSEVVLKVPPTAMVSPRRSSSFVRLYEATRAIPYFPLAPSNQLTVEPVATARVSPRIVHPQQQQQRTRNQTNTGSALWPPSYFQGSSDSDSNSSVSGIYIDPDGNSSDPDS